MTKTYWVTSPNGIHYHYGIASIPDLLDFRRDPDSVSHRIPQESWDSIVKHLSGANTNPWTGSNGRYPLTLIQDEAGNFVRIRYEVVADFAALENNNYGPMNPPILLRPARVEYGGHVTRPDLAGQRDYVDLRYGDPSDGPRSDAFYGEPAYAIQGGAAVLDVLKRIEVHSDTEVTRLYNLEYSNAQSTATTLDYIETCDGEGQCLPRTEFTYTQSDIEGSRFGAPFTVSDRAARKTIAADLNGDGFTDLTLWDKKKRKRLYTYTNGSGAESYDAWNFGGFEERLLTTGHKFKDILALKWKADGTTQLLTFKANAKAWLYSLPTPGAPSKLLAQLERHPKYDNLKRLGKIHWMAPLGHDDAIICAGIRNSNLRAIPMRLKAGGLFPGPDQIQPGGPNNWLMGYPNKELPRSYKDVHQNGGTIGGIGLGEGKKAWFHCNGARNVTMLRGKNLRYRVKYGEHTDEHAWFPDDADNIILEPNKKNNYEFDPEPGTGNETVYQWLLQGDFNGDSLIDFMGTRHVDGASIKTVVLGEFADTERVPRPPLTKTNDGNTPEYNAIAVDFNADGADEVIDLETGEIWKLSVPTDVRDLDDADAFSWRSLGFLSIDGLEAPYESIDSFSEFNGDGLPDIVFSDEDGVRVALQEAAVRPSNELERAPRPGFLVRVQHGDSGTDHVQYRTENKTAFDGSTRTPSLIPSRSARPVVRRITRKRPRPDGSVTLIEEELEYRDPRLSGDNHDDEHLGFDRVKRTVRSGIDSLDQSSLVETVTIFGNRSPANSPGCETGPYKGPDQLDSMCRTAQPNRATEVFTRTQDPDGSGWLHHRTVQLGEQWSDQLLGWNFCNIESLCPDGSADYRLGSSDARHHVWTAVAEEAYYELSAGDAFDFSDLGRVEEGLAGKAPYYWRVEEAWPDLSGNIRWRKQYDSEGSQQDFEVYFADSRANEQPPDGFMSVLHRAQECVDNSLVRYETWELGEGVIGEVYSSTEQYHGEHTKAVCIAQRSSADGSTSTITPRTYAFGYERVEYDDSSIAERTHDVRIKTRKRAILDEVTDDEFERFESFLFDGWGNVEAHCVEKGHGATADPGQIGGEAGSPVCSFSLYDTVDGTTPVLLADAKGHLTKQQFDRSDGNLRLEQSANGEVTGFGYDGLGRPTSVHHPDGSVYQFEYASRPDGLLETRFSASTGEASVVISTVDGQTFEQRQSLFGGKTGVVNFDYDAWGRLVEQSEPHLAGDSQNPAFAVTYDMAGRERSLRFSSGFTSDLVTRGLVTTATDPDGYTTTVWRDGMSRVRMVEDSIGSRTCYGYGDYGLLGEVVQYEAAGDIDPDDCVSASGSEDIFARTHDYDLYGRPSFYDDPQTGTYEFQFDALDRLVETRGPGGYLAEFEYDPLGRLLSVERPDERVEYVWDKADALGAVGSLRRLTSSKGSTLEWEYDALARLSAVNWPDDGRRFEYEYEAASSRISRTTYPSVGSASPLQLNYAYSAEGALRQVSSPSTTAGVQALWNLIEVDPAGRPTAMELASGIVVEQSFDLSRGWLTARSAKGLTSGGTPFTLEDSWPRDGRGNLKGRAGSGGAVDSYQHDAASRLTDAVLATGAGASGSSYAYSVLGDRTEENGVPYIYSDATMNMVEIESIGNIGFSYDDRVRLDQKAGVSLSYDQSNRVERITGSGGSSVRYDYDAAGSLIRRTYQDDGGFSGDIEYASRNWMTERDEAGLRTTRSLVDLPGGISFELLQSASGVPGSPPLREEFVFTDPLGSPLAIAAPNGSVRVEDRSFDLFGDPLASSYNSGWSRFRVDDTSVGFAGHENLIDFGFMHFGGRVYDPDIGRFTSPDPYTEDLFSSQGLNKFGYVRGQATQRIDPSGYMSTDGGGAWSAGGAAIGAGIGGAIALGKGLRELIQNGSHHNGQGITPHALGTNLKNLLPVRSFSSATRHAARGVAVGTPSFGASHQGALRAWAGTNQLLEDNAGIIIRTLAEVAPHVVGFAAGITPSTLEQAYTNTNDRINRVSAELRAQHPLMSAYDVADGYARAATSYDVVRNAAWNQYKPANEVTKASFDISNIIGGLFTGGGGGQSFADDVAPLADDLAGAAGGGGGGARFIGTESGTSVHRSQAELVKSLQGAGATRVGPTTATTEAGEIFHMQTPGGPMEIRVMQGRPGGGPLQGPRTVNTRPGTKEYVNPDGSRIEGAVPKAERKRIGHIHGQTR